MSSIRKFILNGNLKFAFAALLALTFFAVHPASNVSAKPKKAKYGTIKILTDAGWSATHDRWQASRRND